MSNSPTPSILTAAAAAAEPAQTEPAAASPQASPAPAAPAAAAPAAPTPAADDGARREAAEAAAKAERERILGIQAAAFPGQEQLVSEMINSGKSVGEAALAFNAAEKKTRQNELAGIKSVESVTGVVAAAPSASGHEDKPAGQGATTEEGWRAEYKASADLQSEYGSEDAYVAYQSAVASGRVRVLGKRSA